MPPQLGCQTFRSHGKEIARIHMHDWIILFLLVVIEVVLNVIEPFHRFVGADMMTDLKYPMKDNTIPVWAVPIIAIILPFTVMLGFFFRGTGRNVYDLHQAILGLLFSVLITGVITDAIKDGVGRPRPDFFWRCFPDGKGVFDSVTGNVKCTGLKNVIKEGHKSFPSGHTSWSFAGLGFLSWYLSGKIKAFDQQGHAAKLCIVVLPLLFAALVGVSRVDDYWHHWQDVFAGGFIGFTVASFCYLQFFPPPYDVVSCMPHIHNARTGESRNGIQPPIYDQSSSLTVRQTELENVYARSQHGLAITEFNVPDSSPILSDVESGRRY